MQIMHIYRIQIIKWVKLTTKIIDRIISWGLKVTEKSHFSRSFTKIFNKKLIINLWSRKTKTLVSISSKQRIATFASSPHQI